MKKTEQCRQVLQSGKEKAMAEDKPVGVDHILVALVEWFEEGDSEDDLESGKVTTREVVSLNMIGTVSRILDRMETSTRRATLDWLVKRNGFRLKGRGLKE